MNSRPTSTSRPKADVTSIVPAVDADARKIAVRYLGEAEGGQFTDENLTPTAVVIRMRPQRWLSTDYLEGVAAATVPATPSKPVGNGSSSRWKNFQDRSSINDRRA